MGLSPEEGVGPVDKLEGEDRVSPHHTLILLRPAGVKPAVRGVDLDVGAGQAIELVLHLNHSVSQSLAHSLSQGSGLFQNLRHRQGWS